jgi:hypothetical protein
VATVARSGSPEPPGGAGGAPVATAEALPATGTDEAPATGTGTAPATGTDEDAASGADEDAASGADEAPATLATVADEPASAEPGQANGAAGSVVPAPREAAGQPLAVGQQEEPAS